MKTRALIWLVAVLAAVAALTVYLLLLSRSNSQPRGTNRNDLSPSTLITTPSAGLETESPVALVRRGFDSIFEGMKKAGAKEVPPIAKQLQDAIKSGEHATITRAFHEAIYDSFARMSEAVPAIKDFLSHEDPFVRYSAAEALCRAGNRDGVPTLIEMVEANEPISEAKQDLRVQAARLLAKFREHAAAGIIVELYSKTKNGELLIGLATLGVRASEASKWPFVASDLAVTNYGKTGAIEFVSQLRSTFASTNDPELKNASAWTLARLTGEQAYVNYLVQTVQTAINANPRNGELRFDDSAAALRYLGSLQSPVAKQVLERALDSNNPVAVQYAVVNLLFNQPNGSDKAKQVVLRELRGEQSKLGTELMLNVAAQIDDPEIRAEGEAFDQRSGDRSWNLYAVKRRQWPIYNWIDDYVVALKSSGK